MQKLTEVELLQLNNLIMQIEMRKAQLQQAEMEHQNQLMHIFMKYGLKPGVDKINPTDGTFSKTELISSPSPVINSTGNHKKEKKDQVNEQSKAE